MNPKNRTTLKIFETIQFYDLQKVPYETKLKELNIIRDGAMQKHREHNIITADIQKVVKDIAYQHRKLFVLERQLDKLKLEFNEALDREKENGEDFYHKVLTKVYANGGFEI